MALRIIFAGTPDFAVPHLQALMAAKHQVVAAYTQPDRPAGRGRKLTPSPVKQLALTHNLPVYQPASLKAAEAQATLKQLNADLMVVVAYGLILPQAVLNTPKFGCINVHASLLPRWRGAAPIQRAILAGDKETGITIMQMAAGLDTGAMLNKKSCPITTEDTSQTLHEQLAKMGAEILLETLAQLENNALKPIPQDESKATYAHKITKQEAQIDWQQSAEELARKVQAFNPWPVACCHFNQQTLRIWQAEALQMQTHRSPGTLHSASKDGIDITTGNGILRLKILQLPGKKSITAAQFYQAHNQNLAPNTTQFS